MSAMTKIKYVYKEMDEFPLPKENQTIVKVISGCGNNLHEVVTPSGETFLVSMPPKFRKTVWVKRGNYVIIEPIKEGKRVRGEIVHILYDNHIEYIVSQNLWPSEFELKLKPKSTEMIPSHLLPPSDSESLSDELPDEISFDNTGKESGDDDSLNPDDVNGDIFHDSDENVSNNNSPAHSTRSSTPEYIR